MLPTLAASRRWSRSWSPPGGCRCSCSRIGRERFDAYAASWLAIAASGTVSLEAALAGLPMVTIYRTGPLTGWLARRLIKVPHVNLVNLILGRPAVPELLQEDCHPERIAAAAARLLEDDELRESAAGGAGRGDRPARRRR